jgi:hypothetical protein
MGETLKLTKAQKAFLADLSDEHTTGMTVECLPHEWRTAQSLARRGLCVIVSERNEMGYFEAMVPKAAALASHQGGDAT